MASSVFPNELKPVKTYSKSRKNVRPSKRGSNQSNRNFLSLSLSKSKSRKLTISSSESDWAPNENNSRASKGRISSSIFGTMSTPTGNSSESYYVYKDKGSGYTVERVSAKKHLNTVSESPMSEASSDSSIELLRDAPHTKDDIVMPGSPVHIIRKEVTKKSIEKYHDNRKIQTASKRKITPMNSTQLSITCGVQMQDLTNIEDLSAISETDAEKAPQTDIACTYSPAICMRKTRDSKSSTPRMNKKVNDILEIPGLSTIHSQTGTCMMLEQNNENTPKSKAIHPYDIHCKPPSKRMASKPEKCGKLAPKTSTFIHENKRSEANKDLPEMSSIPKLSERELLVASLIRSPTSKSVRFNLQTSEESGTEAEFIHHQATNKFSFQKLELMPKEKSVRRLTSTPLRIDETIEHVCDDISAVEPSEHSSQLCIGASTREVLTDEIVGTSLNSLDDIAEDIWIPQAKYTDTKVISKNKGDNAKNNDTTSPESGNVSNSSSPNADNDDSESVECEQDNTGKSHYDQGIDEVANNPTTLSNVSGNSKRKGKKQNIVNSKNGKCTTKPKNNQYSLSSQSNKYETNCKSATDKVTEVKDNTSGLKVNSNQPPNKHQDTSKLSQRSQNERITINSELTETFYNNIPICCIELFPDLPPKPQRLWQKTVPQNITKKKRKQ